MSQSDEFASASQTIFSCIIGGRAGMVVPAPAKNPGSDVTAYCIKFKRHVPYADVVRRYQTGKGFNSQLPPKNEPCIAVPVA